MTKRLLQKILDYILKNRRYFEISEFDGDIFCLNNAAFPTISLKYKILQILLYPPKKRNGYICALETKNFNKVAKVIYQKYKNKPSAFEKLFRQREKNLLTVTQKLAKAKGADKNSYKNFINAFRGFGSIAIFSLEALEKYLKEKIEEEIQDRRKFELLTLPLYISYIQKRDTALLEKVKTLQKKEIELIRAGKLKMDSYKKFPQVFEEYLKKWGWSFLNYSSQKELALRDILKYLSENFENLKKQQNSLIKTQKRRLQKKKELKGIPSKLKRLIDFFDLIVQLRDQRKATWLKTIVPGKNWMKLASGQSGLHYRQIKWLTYKEQLALTKNTAEKFAQLAGKRIRGSADIFGFGKAGSIIVTEENYKKISQAILRRQKSEVLKGISASPGRVKGMVKIISGAKDFKKFIEGEILVASHTTPDFVPLMQKAKAILTERGGLTSHAAILSRELKKPCVVGIKGLFGNFNDGDKIEVDANRGVVKIIKRS